MGPTTGAVPVNDTRWLTGLSSERLRRILTATVIGAALVLGGGTHQGLWSDAVVQLAGLVLLAVLLPILTRQPTSVEHQTAVLGLVGVIALLPLVQLVPLPPSLWPWLPGRTTIAIAYGATGVSLPWLPISLDPAATWRSFLSLSPPIAAFCATICLGMRARRGLVLVVIAAGVVSVLLGLAQLMQGPLSPLRFYPETNPDNSVGFFANRNHYAALLYSVIPLTSAWIVGLLFDRRIDRVFGLAVCVLVYAALILGLGMALSRAGVFLAVIAAIASLLLVGSHHQRIARHGFLIVAGATGLGAVAVVQFALFDLLGRFDDNLLADYRLRIAQNTIAAAKAVQPFGSGFGTFVPVYQMFEPVSALLPAYVNHAHDDWLELWLEGGWLGLAVLTVFLVWFARATYQVWQRQHDGRALDRAIAQAASIVIVLLLLHSIVDYPLHTTALATLFAFCCALLIDPKRPEPAERAHGGGDGGQQSAHHRSSRSRWRRGAVWQGRHASASLATRPALTLPWPPA